MIIIEKYFLTACINFSNSESISLPETDIFLNLVGAKMAGGTRVIVRPKIPPEARGQIIVSACGIYISSILAV